MTKISKSQADVVRMPNETEIEAFKSPEDRAAIDHYLKVDSDKRVTRSEKERAGLSAAWTGLMVYCSGEKSLADLAQESAMRSSLAA